RMTIILILLAGVQQLTKYEFFNHENKAYGLNYKVQKATYNSEVLDIQSYPKYTTPDKKNTHSILKNWKEKQTERKPKMILLCVSGGGMKAATWTTQVMQQVDKATNGELMQHTSLISGASGGMLGAAYMREVYLQKALGRELDVYDNQYIDNISTDLLNSIMFTIVANDLFLPWATFKYGGQKYYKDRGYIFEKQFNENTHGFLDKTLGAYKIPEQRAVIPMMFITPAIVNDGRRMVISPQGVSYMTKTPITNSKRETVKADAVDFGKIFAEQDAMNLKFSTALRMNATYPYVLPNVHLPSKPEIEVLDAGFRDNHGISSATRFIHVFKDWILKNTSGVVLVQIDTKDQINQIDASDQDGLIGSIFNPLGIAAKLLKLQEFEHDTNLGFIFDILGEQNFDVIRFSYQPTKKNVKASMTYHLTEREKQDILRAFYLEENQENLKELKHILNIEHTPISKK
ncbi:MAG: patatin-like phospholipase family protein, partial [Bacteroidota bacterium]